MIKLNDYIMQAKSFLLDYFYENPSWNLLVPDNPLKLQDTLRKALNGSNFLLTLNGVNVLNTNMDALFFQIHSKYCTRSSKLSVMEILQKWQKQDSKFKIIYDQRLQMSQKNKRSSQIYKSKNMRKSESQVSMLQSNTFKLKQNIQNRLDNKVLPQKANHSKQINDKVSQKIISNFFVEVNKVKNQKDQKIIKKTIQEYIDNFVDQLDLQDIPYSKIINKLHQQIPWMNLDQQTSSIMENLVKQYKKQPKRTKKHSQIVLKNLLFQSSNPDSPLKTKIKKTATQFNKKQQQSAIITTHTMKITKKQSQSNAKTRRLKLIFQSFSLASKNRRGLTFDELKDQSKKMDLNSWMSFNKKYQTISKLGIQEVHMIFKRYSHLGLFDYPRFQKAFKDLSKQLFPKDITQAYYFFGIDNDGQVKIRSKFHLPLISQSSQNLLKLKQPINLNNISNSSMKISRSRFLNNKSLIESKHLNNKSIQKSLLKFKQNQFPPHDIPRSSRGLKLQVTSQLKNRIKKLKNKA